MDLAIKQVELGNPRGVSLHYFSIGAECLGFDNSSPGGIIFSMRLKIKERNAVTQAIRSRDPQARVVLFGSRADDQRLGGDIDLLVFSDKLGFRDEWPIRRDILDQIGWQRLDMIIRRKHESPDPISRIALETGVDL